MQSTVRHVRPNASNEGTARLRGRSMWRGTQFLCYTFPRLMALTFAKAPLIELIAELRWIPQGSTTVEPPQQQPTFPTVFIGGVKQEEFYTRVSGALSKSGFNRSERLSQ